MNTKVINVPKNVSVRKINKSYQARLAGNFWKKTNKQTNKNIGILQGKYYNCFLSLRANYIKTTLALIKCLLADSP